MVYVNQIIMLYTLNLFSFVYQLYLNKTGRKNKMRMSSKWGIQFWNCPRSSQIWIDQFTFLPLTWVWTSVQVLHSDLWFFFLDRMTFSIVLAFSHFFTFCYILSSILSAFYWLRPYSANLGGIKSAMTSPYHLCIHSHNCPSHPASQPAIHTSVLSFIHPSTDPSIH